MRSLVFCLMLVLLPARAAELVAVGAHFERVFEQNAAGEFTGMGPEILRALAQRMGVSIRFEILPWPRAHARLVAGQADILIGPYKTPEREREMAFSERAFYQDAMVFYALKDHPVQWQGNVKALGQQRIVVMNGWVYGQAFDGQRAELKLSVANAVENGLKMLAYEHADLFAANRRNTDPVIARLAWQDKFVVLQPPLQVQKGFFAFPRKPAFDPLRLQFDRAMRAYVDAGELQRLGRKLDVAVPRQ